MHHIGSDVWSWRLLCRELGELYEAFLSNREPSLAQSPMQYADFAAWQFEALRTGSFADHLSYWRRNLAGAPGLIDLPHDYPRPALQGFRGVLHRCRTVVLEALAHQDLPFEKLVEELRPERSASHLPLVQVMFALQDELALNLRLPSVSVTPLAIDTGTAKFDLTMTVVE